MCVSHVETTIKRTYLLILLQQIENEEFTTWQCVKTVQVQNLREVDGQASTLPTYVPERVRSLEGNVDRCFHACVYSKSARTSDAA